MLEEDGTTSDGADSDRFSGSVSSFLANEKLMSFDSLNSDDTGAFWVLSHAMQTHNEVMLPCFKIYIIEG